LTPTCYMIMKDLTPKLPNKRLGFASESSKLSLGKLI
jgi:hypothetical protein